MSALTDLLQEARVIGGDLSWVDIKLGPHGVAIIVWDDQSYESTDDMGNDVTIYVGNVVTCGMGATMDEAIAAANAGLKSRAGA